jgi:hypothetical protein
MDRLGEEILDIANESIAELMRDADLDACKIEILRKAGMFDTSTIKALIIREWAGQLLESLPRV